MNTARQIALALTMALGVARPVWAHGEDDRPQGKMPEKLGEVSFPVSCNAAAQREFNRAMALFHLGVAHYLIHTYDYAELAEKGLPSEDASSSPGRETGRSRS
jgi:hypothetical protein